MNDRVLSYYNSKVEFYRRQVKVLKKMNRGAIISSYDREIIKGTKGRVSSRLKKATQLLNCYEEKAYGRKRHLGSKILEGRISNPDCEGVFRDEGGSVPTAEDLAELEGALGLYEEGEAWVILEELYISTEGDDTRTGPEEVSPI